jgi:hypothetical protein
MNADVSKGGEMMIGSENIAYNLRRNRVVKCRFDGLENVCRND